MLDDPLAKNRIAAVRVHASRKLKEGCWCAHASGTLDPPEHTSACAVARAETVIALAARFKRTEVSHGS